MSKPLAEVTDTELTILNVLWTRGSLPVREITEQIYSQHTPALHATVKSLLERLAEKGYVDCDRSRFAHRFCAIVKRETYVGQQLQNLADSHFHGSLAPMLMTLIEQVKLKRQDRLAIRQMIESIPE